MSKLNETISKLEAWIDDPNAMDTEIDACLVADALELLKEQQEKIDGLLEDLATAIDDKESALLMLKEKQPRVLTLYEVSNAKYPEDVFCEIKDENRVFAVTAPVPIQWRAHPDIRYWTARPTDEQRKAVPWKDGDGE